MSSKRAVRRRACEGKRSYETREEARRVQGRMVRQGEAGPLNVYHCARCGAWHVGHQPAKVRQAIASRRDSV